MIIKRLTIRSFGRLHKKTLEFSPGINVLYGENESGKTTLHTFIRSMLYGITRQRGRASRNDVYTKYEPWEDPAAYGGTLWFARGGKSYRLSRCFYKENLTAELFCEDDGEFPDLEQGALEQLLGGLSETVYENTVSVAQLKGVTGPALARELQNYMASYQGTGDSSLDLARAMQFLKMSRKGYQVQKEKRQKEMEKEQEKLKDRMEYVGAEMEELRLRQAKVARKEEALGVAPGEGNGGDLIEEKIKELRVRMLAFAAAALIALLLGLAGLLGRPEATDRVAVYGWTFCIAAGAAAAVFCVNVVRRVGRELKKQRKLKRRWEAQQEKLKWNREALKESYEEKMTDFENLQEEYREYEAQAGLPSGEDTEIQALNLAMETIESISGNIHRQSRRLRQRTSRILGEITRGKYREVLMDKELQLTVNTEDRSIPAERLSRGTIEQIYFALRMAAADLFCGAEKFPVILDDVFGMYDEERLAAVLHWLEKEERQVIISTCSKREAELLEKEGIAFQMIRL